MIPALLLGLVAGLGIWLVAHGLRVRRPPLSDALDAISTPRWSSANTMDRGVGGVVTRVVGFLDRPGAARVRLGQDLAVLEKDLGRYALDKLQTTGLIAGVPLVSWLITSLAGVGLPPALCAIYACPKRKRKF